MIQRNELQHIGLSRRASLLNEKNLFTEVIHVCLDWPPVSFFRTHFLLYEPLWVELHKHGRVGRVGSRKKNAKVKPTYFTVMFDNSVQHQCQRKLHDANETIAH